MNPYLTLLGIPLELRHQIFEYAFDQEEGPVLVLKQYLERVDPEIDTSMPIRRPILSPANQAQPVRFGRGTDDDGYLDDQDDQDDQDEAEDDYYDGNDDNDDDDDDGDFRPNGETDQDQEQEEEDKDGVSAVLGRIPSWNGRVTKYRHTIPIIQLSHSPPQLSLLLSCKQLCHEALEFYYAHAGLYIDMTLEFGHYSLFELVINNVSKPPPQLTRTQASTSAFKLNSPVDQLRRLVLRVVWDSETINSLPDGQGDVLESVLALRAATVLDLLRGGDGSTGGTGKKTTTTGLRTVRMHWHDTARTERSEALMHNVCSQFAEVARGLTNVKTGKSVEFEVKEYWYEGGEDERLDGLLDRRRSEFSRIANMGMRGID